MKRQQGKAKAQDDASKDKPDNANKLRAHKFKGKASHSDQIKISKKGIRVARTHNDNMLPHDTQSDWDTQDKDILIGDKI